MSDSEPTVEAAVSADRALLPIGRWLMAVALLVLNVIDVYLTKAILGRGGVESNPIMRPIIHDALSPIVLKTAISLGVAVLLLASPREAKWADRAVGVVLVAYTLVMGWNLGILLQSIGLHPGR